jgi:hypothetical protein
MIREVGPGSGRIVQMVSDVCAVTATIGSEFVAYQPDPYGRRLAL